MHENKTSEMQERFSDTDFSEKAAEPTDEQTLPAEVSATVGEVITEENVGEGERDEIQGRVSPITDEKEAEALCSHPMFTRFAFGRREPFDELLGAFREMLRASQGDDLRKEIEAKMTPSATMTTADVPLTARQRAICHAAGMTYREYYSLMENKT